MTDPQHSTTDANCADCDANSADEPGVCPTKRRRLLAGLAVGGSAALAGCTGLLGTPGEYEVRGSDDVYDVSFEQAERTIEIRGSQTVLRAAEEQEISVPYDCRAGFCGVCLSRADDDATTAVHMATNNYDRLTEAAVEAGYFLPCTSQPRDDFSVTTGVSPGELDEYAPDDPDNDDEPNDEPDDVGRRHAIKYLNEGWIIPVGERQDLLRAAEDVGLDELPYQCRVGRCGVCLSRIDGDATELVEHESIDYGPLDEDALRDGYVLTCTAQPRGEFELETNRAGDL
ncbi:ferredoxin [Halalkaliarchaeum desulfuricum]|uniref:Ferredoxin n=1 Tax=Halalkaliarchaeum desulfuricum TaxID=2055893 RepID=A0A343TLM5_9EURY|nr:2Fe-2S iron-sulfur cluster-binding protein [Halalkaliarchaeum desulfuricum]AUX09997.1 ferredoxin [Halalkaliarchaeum desulfuricum]